MPVVLLVWDSRINGADFIGNNNVKPLDIIFIMLFGASIRLVPTDTNII